MCNNVFLNILFIGPIVSWLLLFYDYRTRRVKLCRFSDAYDYMEKHRCSWELICRDQSLASCLRSIKQFFRYVCTTVEQSKTYTCRYMQKKKNNPVFPFLYNYIMVYISTDPRQTNTLWLTIKFSRMPVTSPWSVSSYIMVYISTDPLQTNTLCLIMVFQDARTSPWPRRSPAADPPVLQGWSWSSAGTLWWRSPACSAGCAAWWSCRTGSRRCTPVLDRPSWSYQHHL